MAEAFLINPDFGSRVQYSFSNQAHPVFGGEQHINALWEQPLAKINFSLAWLNQTTFEYLTLFYDTVNGSQDTFLFLDPFDFEATSDYYDTGKGVLTRGVMIEEAGVFQFAKKYVFGTGTTELGIGAIYRPITRPNTVTVYDGLGTEVISPVIDFNTGIITGASEDWTWEGTFWIPCRFENDTLPLETKRFDTESSRWLYNLPDLRITEVKEDNLIVTQEVDKEYAFNYTLPWEYNNRLDKASQTDIYQARSGYELRNLIHNNLREITFSESWLDEQSKTFLVGLWRLCLGTYSNFLFDDAESGITGKYRFTETIAFSLLVQDDSIAHALYAANNLNLVQEIDPVKTTQTRLWKVTKPLTGEVLGFTEHDQRIFLSPDNYKANLGITGSSNSTTSELNTDTTDLTSVAVAFNITEEEIVGEQLTNAPIEVYLYNWLTNTNIRTLFVGKLGEYELEYFGSTAKKYSINAVSLSNDLDSSDTVRTSFSCGHEFLEQGYYRCNATINFQSRISGSIVSATKTTVTVSGNPNANFITGTLKPLDGILQGQKFTISNIVGNVIHLLNPTPLSLAPGTTIEITAFCNKTVDHCKNRWDNLLNHSGLPQLQGTDLTVVSSSQ